MLGFRLLQKSFDNKCGWERVEFDPYQFGVYLSDASRKDPYYILNQATGLKDKSGKMIYEGDVVKVVDVSFGCSRVDIVNDVVDFLRDNPRSGFVHSFEILGNIYDNPELKEMVTDDL